MLLQPAPGICLPHIVRLPHCSPRSDVGVCLRWGSHGQAGQTALSAGPAVSLTGPDSMLTAGRRLPGARQRVLPATCHGFVALAAA